MTITLPEKDEINEDSENDSEEDEDEDEKEEDEKLNRKTTTTGRETKQHKR